MKMLLDTLAVSGDKVMKYEAMIDELTSYAYFNVTFGNALEEYGFFLDCIILLALV